MANFGKLQARVLTRLSAGLALLATAFGLASVPAIAGGTWDGLKPEVFGQRKIESGLGVVTIKAPFRPEDQRAVPVSIDVRLVDGRTVKSVTLVVDENPSPVAAVFSMGEGRTRIGLKTAVRLNQETQVRAIVEASDGALYMSSQLVKFAGGQAACSAPPTGNPEEIAANMGKMQLADVERAGNVTEIEHRVRLKISHPNHTGMALDQQTLLYIPLRMITALEVSQGETKLFDMTGSITIAENPVLEFPVSLTGDDQLKVVLKDSDGSQWSRTMSIRAGS